MHTYIYCRKGQYRRGEAVTPPPCIAGFDVSQLRPTSASRPYIYMYIYMYTYTYMYMYIYIHTYMYTSSLPVVHYESQHYSYRGINGAPPPYITGFEVSHLRPTLASQPYVYTNMCIYLSIYLSLSIYIPIYINIHTYITYIHTHISSFPVVRYEPQHHLISPPPVFQVLKCRTFGPLRRRSPLPTPRTRRSATCSSLPRHTTSPRAWLPSLEQRR